MRFAALELINMNDLPDVKHGEIVAAFSAAITRAKAV